MTKFKAPKPNVWGYTLAQLEAVRREAIAEAILELERNADKPLEDIINAIRALVD